MKPAFTCKLSSVDIYVIGQLAMPIVSSLSCNTKSSFGSVVAFYDSHDMLHIFRRSIHELITIEWSQASLIF